ncbi:MAG: hypothetical protein ACXW4Q_12460, partial [Anaerolineales bacterium]
MHCTVQSTPALAGGARDTDERRILALYQNQQFMKAFLKKVGLGTGSKNTRPTRPASKSQRSNMSNYDIKDINQAEGGRRRMDWAE